MAKCRALSAVCVSVCVVAVVPSIANGAGTRCAQSLIRDWYVDGQIQGRYSAGCYRSALAQVPSGLVAYGNVRTVLSQRLASTVAHQSKAREPRRRHSIVYAVAAAILAALLAARVVARRRGGRFTS